MTRSMLASNKTRYIQFLNYFKKHKIIVCFYEEQA